MSLGRAQNQDQFVGLCYGVYLFARVLYSPKSALQRLDCDQCPAYIFYVSSPELNINCNGVLRFVGISIFSPSNSFNDSAGQNKLISSPYLREIQSSGLQFGSQLLVGY
jgi:hypothetical protein